MTPPILGSQQNCEADKVGKELLTQNHPVNVVSEICIWYMQ